MEFIIRKAQLKDLADLQVLMEQLTGHVMKDGEMADRFRMIDASPIDELYVLERDRKIQGVLGFRIRENLEEVSRYGEVSVVVTLSASRRKGIGHALMHFAEELAKKRGCKGTWLVSGFGREQDAHKFYAKLGYQITGYRFVKML